MRSDLALIADLIQPNARVLDLGCGDGELLAELATTKQVNGYGLDVDADNIRRCLERGVNVVEQDLNLGLDNFADNSFDMVVMTETLQSVRNPSDMLDDMLRIARECVVTFPNFGHWRCRAHLLLRGSMPVAKHLPHDWFNTPNIHLCTFKDFERLCHDKRLNIIERLVIDANSSDAARTPKRRPAANLFGATAFYHLGR